VLVEHLPPGNPLWRSRNGDWGQQEYLLHSVESRLRDLLTLTFNIHRKEDVSPKEVEYLPLPDTPEDEEQKRAQAEYDEIMRRQLEEL
jgi:hypothetical protein